MDYAEFFRGTAQATHKVRDAGKRYQTVTYWYNSLELGTKTSIITRGKVESIDYDLTEAGKKIAAGASPVDVALGRV